VSFFAEAFARFLAGDSAGRKNFEGDVAIELLIVRAVHDTHATGGKLGDDAIVAERLPDHGTARSLWAGILGGTRWQVNGGCCEDGDGFSLGADGGRESGHPQNCVSIYSWEFKVFCFDTDHGDIGCGGALVVTYGFQYWGCGTNLGLTACSQAEAN